MAKRIWSIVFIGILLGSLFITFYLLKDRIMVGADPYAAVPADASLIIETKDLQKASQKLLEDNLIWQELLGIPSVNEVDLRVHRLDSIIETHKPLKELFFSSPLYISIHHFGKQELSLLYLTLNSGNHTINSIKTTIERSFGEDMSIREKEYQKTKMLDILNNTTGNKMFVATYKGIIIFSASSILVERSIRQLDLDENILDQKGFLKVRNTSGRNVEGNVYVNFKYVSQFLSILLKPPYNDMANALARFADWAELDLSIEDDMLLLNGFIISDDSVNSYLNLFRSQTPQKLSMDQILPANTMTYVAFGLDDINNFTASYTSYLADRGDLQEHQKKIAEVESKWNEGIRKLFLDQIDNEIGVAFTDIKNLSFAENSFTIFKVQSYVLAEEYIVDALKNFYNQKGERLEAHTNTIEVDQQTQTKIYELPVGGIPESLFGSLFGGAEYRHLTFVGNYMIFGNDHAALSSFIHNQVLHKTLINDFDYKTFIESLSARSNFFFYSGIPKSISFYNKFLEDDLETGYKTHVDIFNKIQAVGLQFSVENNMVYNNLLLKYQPEYREKAETQWESLLDTLLWSKPHFVINHYTKEKELFVQDMKNTIYLMNGAGRILWKINIPERINGEVFQIDFYKNGKLQLLFNTENYLHLIDRNGNYVENYPVKLRSKAVNGLALFDYDNNKNYRFALCCEDKKVYLFTSEGKTVRGWNMMQTEGLIETLIYHFREGTRDYIVFGDRNKVYILNRKGNHRIHVQEPISKPTNQTIYFDHQRTNSRFVTTDQDGTVCFIELDGRVEKLAIKTFTANHYFEYSDLDGNGSKEFVFVDGNKLEVFDSKGIPLFSYTFNFNIQQKPVIYTFSSTDKKIGISCEIGSLIYLFNKDGTLYPNFPLLGRTLFSIGQFSYASEGYNLIVGGDDNFLYNYSVK